MEVSHFLIFSDKGGWGVGQFLILADKREGGSANPQFWLTSHVNNPYPIYNKCFSCVMENFNLRLIKVIIYRIMGSKGVNKTVFIAMCFETASNSLNADLLLEIFKYSLNLAFM